MTLAAKPRERAGARPISKQRLRLWLRLLRAARAIEGELREKLRKEFAITLPQFDVMAALARRDGGKETGKEAGMNMTELSRMLMVSNGNVTGIIDRLAAEKLVQRQAPASDRRSFIVRLTPKGAAQFAVIAKAHEGWVDDLLAGFDAAEAEILIEQLGDLASSVGKGGTHI
jgi:DNA-binding MarR family transcriptional regulator